MSIFEGNFRALLSLDFKLEIIPWETLQLEWYWIIQGVPEYVGML